MTRFGLTSLALVLGLAYALPAVSTAQAQDSRDPANARNLNDPGTARHIDQQDPNLSRLNDPANARNLNDPADRCHQAEARGIHDKNSKCDVK